MKVVVENSEADIENRRKEQARSFARAEVERALIDLFEARANPTKLLGKRLRYILRSSATLTKRMNFPIPHISPAPRSVNGVAYGDP